MKRKLVSMQWTPTSALKLKPDFENRINALEELNPHVRPLCSGSNLWRPIFVSTPCWAHCSRRLRRRPGWKRMSHQTRRVARLPWRSCALSIRSSLHGYPQGIKVWSRKGVSKLWHVWITLIQPNRYVVKKINRFLTSWCLYKGKENLFHPMPNIWIKSRSINMWSGITIYNYIMGSN